MKKAFILLISLVAIMTANLNVMAQETATAKAPMGNNVNRSQASFITDGNWNDGSNWDTGVVPDSDSDVVIMANAVIPAGYIAVANEVSIEGGSITVADGGQLRHNTDNLVVTMKKNIEPYDDANGTDNYYLLAFPFNVDVEVPNAMTAIEGYDFYKFDGDFIEAEWRNNKQETIATVCGTTGYLYANSEAIELSLTGSTYPSYNEEVIPVTIPYDEGSTNPSNGWALLGNPFTCNAYIFYHNSDNELVPMDFMVYDATGELVTLSGEPIAPMQGFFVKVTETTTVYILNYADHSFHEYVDLGLPSGTLWATCNVGANTPEEYGDYFAWGETQPKEIYQFYNYQFGEQLHINKYCTQDYLIVLLPEDDAATANWGANWRMARVDEWQELRDNTTRTLTTQNGVKGLLYTASNGNSIFMPAAGYRYGSSIGGAKSYGYYWTSSIGTDYQYNARKIYFYSNNYYIYNDYRCYGMSVRAVRSAPQSFIIEATVDPAESGTISGDGTYEQGRICTLTATANEGYVFNNWSENGVLVSTEPTIAFTVNENRNLVAHFAVIMDGHGYVDLGLPSGLLWANCNVGADNPEDYGDYFAWGETQPKDNYSWGTYQYCMGTKWDMTKYCNKSAYGYNGFTDNLTTLLPEDDAATANWGSEWRMPTQEEWQELFDNTTNTWTQQNGVNGRLFTASNGNSLFLPAAGSINVTSNINIGSDNYCWSSSLSMNYPYYAWSVYLSRYSPNTYERNRFFGHTVRAVRSSGQNTAPTGAIDSKFTINGDGDQVYFSQGNLQYQASTNTWKFAESQYDYIGDANSNISSSYDGWIDLFGWGTSGYHDANDPYNVNYQPWSSSDSELNNDYNTYGYGPSTNMPDMNLTGTSANYDWGVNNPISNGGNTANQWRTLTQPEWSYVLNTRNTTSGIRFAKAQVNEVNGVILLPDDWTTDTYNLNNTNNIGASYNSNVINASQWAMIENAGGVFLPAAGGRFGTTVADVGSAGFYWLSSSNSSCCAYYVYIYNFGIYLVDYRRYLGRSVRLVCDVES